MLNPSAIIAIINANIDIPRVNFFILYSSTSNTPHFTDVIHLLYLNYITVDMDIL